MLLNMQKVRGLKWLNNYIGKIVHIFTHPKIFKQPTSLFVCEGEKAVFKISARGKRLQYKWQYYNEVSDKWCSVTATDADGVFSDTLTIPACIGRNEIQYRCVIIGENFYCNSNSATLYVKELELFLQAMRKKAKSIGLKNTVITSPTGMNVTTMSTALDMLVMVTAAYESGKFDQIWGKIYGTIKVFGTNDRTLQLKSTVDSKLFEQTYRIIGGKTGTLPRKNKEGFHNVLVIIAEDNLGRIFAGSVMDAQDRWCAMKALFDLMINMLDENMYDMQDENKICSDSCAGWQILEGRPNKVLYEKNSSKKYVMASSVKILTLLTAFDYIGDLNDLYTIRKRDIRNGSGNIFQEGDVVKIFDLMRAAMLPSSNTAATAIANYIGESFLVT